MAKIPYSPVSVFSESFPVDVWDCEKKEKIHSFDTQAECARFLGVTSSVIAKSLGRRDRIKPETNKLGLLLTIRKSKV